ncbi:hypothetical protein [Kaistella carnis]|uniref:Uncharacterized protein n=1 Tax=Kaistella carnis TaxID=1241979 RepID=A0A3G8XMU1_9FLAO|nr:hypothetical protein [Kaistella carnis]AZI34399.1 hypothetical protein EIB73_14970 [Kaistella carnis]
MDYTIVGLFPNEESITRVSYGLEKSGFKQDDFIVYKRNLSERKKNVWNSLFGSESYDRPNTDTLITSVAVRTEEELKDITQSFNENNVVKIYEFKDMTIDEAKDLNYIKKIVSVRAKSQVYGIPQMSVSASLMNEL